MESERRDHNEPKNKDATPIDLHHDRSGIETPVGFEPTFTALRTVTVPSGSSVGTNVSCCLRESCDSSHGLPFPSIVLSRRRTLYFNTTILRVSVWLAVFSE